MKLYNTISLVIDTTFIFYQIFVLCWDFTAQSTQWGHVERDQFT